MDHLFVLSMQDAFKKEGLVVVNWCEKSLNFTMVQRGKKITKEKIKKLKNFHQTYLKWT